MSRVLFVCSHLRVGGAQRQWSLLIPALAERGWDPHVLALEAKGEFFEELRSRGIPATCARMRSRFDLAAVGRALRAARLGPRIVVTHGVRGQLVGQMLARRCGIAHVTVDHRAPGFPFKFHREALIRAVAPHVHRAVAVSPTQIPQLVARRYRRDAIRVIPNGVDGMRLTAGRTREATRAELDIEPDAFVALLVAVLRPEKRADVFVRAVARASRLDPRIKGVVAGAGPAYAAVRRVAGEADGAVRVLGQRGDVGDLLRAADVACLSSAAEAAPMSALEGMALARPVVATDVGGTRDVVVDGETGLLVPEGDEDTFARRLVELAANPERAAALGQAGRLRQQARFSTARMADEYAQLLQETAA